MAKVPTDICVQPMIYSFFLFSFLSSLFFFLFFTQFMFLSFLKTKKCSLAVDLGGGEGCAGVGGGCNHLQQESSEAVLQNKMKPPDLY